MIDLARGGESSKPVKGFWIVCFAIETADAADTGKLHLSDHRSFEVENLDQRLGVLQIRGDDVPTDQSSIFQRLLGLRHHLTPALRGRVFDIDGDYSVLGRLIGRGEVEGAVLIAKEVVKRIPLIEKSHHLGVLIAQFPVIDTVRVITVEHPDNQVSTVFSYRGVRISGVMIGDRVDVLVVLLP